MPRLSQSELQHKVEILVTNGKLPKAQAIVAGVGYDPTGLATGEDLLQAWRDHKNQARAMLAAQKKATQAQATAREAAHDEVRSLSQTLQILFGNDETLLTSVGLFKRRYNGTGDDPEPAENGEPSKRRPARPSRSIAATIARWRLLVTNVQDLDEPYQSRLAQAGWRAERIAATAELIEAYAEANTHQQQKIQAHRAASAAAQTTEAELRRWYQQAARLSKLAIQQTDPENQKQLKVLLGL